MECLGVITHVDEQTDWVSSITYVQKAMVNYICAWIPMTSTRSSTVTITRHPQWRKLLTSLHTLASLLNYMPTMDTGQLSSNRTPACSLLSTVPSVDTTSCDFPLVWSAPKTSSRKRWVRSSKNAKDVSEFQMTSQCMATLRWNMMPTYEISWELPANMTWCSTHRRHMWRPRLSTSLDASTMPMVSTQTLKTWCCTCITSTHKHHQASRVLRSSHLPKSLHPWSIHLDCPSMRAAQEGHRLQLETYLWHCFWADQGSCHQWHQSQVLWPITTHDYPSWCLTVGLGTALLQNGKPVALASKALTETECWYANIERDVSCCLWRGEIPHLCLWMIIQDWIRPQAAWIHL